MAGSNDDWELSIGPDRPLWEPVRLADFRGERLEALQALSRRLRSVSLEQLTEEELAMFAILSILFDQGTVKVDEAGAETVRLATHRLPDPGRRKRKRLTTNHRDDLNIIIGVVWAQFTSYNFPLPSPEA